MGTKVCWRISQGPLQAGLQSEGNGLLLCPQAKGLYECL